MTVQIKDTIFFNNKLYYIVSITDKNTFFDPTSLGYTLYPASSCCWRGYQVNYKIDPSKKLCIDELSLSTDPENVQPINNSKPIILSNITKHNSNLKMFRKKIQCRLAGDILYENVNLPVDYTGYILIAEGFNKCPYKYKPKLIETLYDKDKYINPIELTFANGTLVNYIEI